MTSSGSNVGMKTSAPQINDVVNNALFHSNLASSDSAANHPHLALFLVDSLPHILKYRKCIEVRAVQWTEIWKFIQVCYIIALLDWMQQMMHRMSGQTQLAKR